MARLMPASHVLSRSPSDRHPFMLSALSQEVLTACYRRRALLALLGTLVGVVMTVLYVSAGLTHFG